MGKSISEKRTLRGRTKADLIDAVYRREGDLTRNEAAEIVDTIFRTVRTSLVDGRAVKIKNFGVFEVLDRPGRQGVNPNNGHSLFIPAHKGLNFRPSRQLKELVAPLTIPRSDDDENSGENSNEA